MAVVTSLGRETIRVAADNRLVSDMITCSLISDIENMPRRVNRCDIVRARDLPEIFQARGGILLSGNMCSVIYTRQMRQLLPPTGVKLPGWLRTTSWGVIRDDAIVTSYGRETTRVAADNILVSDKRCRDR